MRSGPRLPVAMSARIIMIDGSKPWLCPTTSTTPLRSAASVIVRHSSIVSAIGFSTMMCFL